MSNNELSNDELREYVAQTVGSMTAVPRRRILAVFDAIIWRHTAALARAEAAEARVAELEAALGEMANHMARLLAERNDALDRAEAAEAERDDANIEVALEQANAREAWQRTAELEALMALGVTVPPPDASTAATP